MKAISKPGFFLLIAAAILSLTSCERDGWNNIRGSGPVYTETRDLPIHRDISIAIPADVYIYQSLAKEVSIEAQANVLDVIESRVRDSELEIKLENGVRLGSHEPINIYISSAMFNNIRLSGAVNLYGETPVVTDVLDVNISGKGEVDLKIMANTVKASISGTGQMWLEGTAITEVFTISGTGDIHAFSLLCETADVSISGSGNVEIDAAEYLDARISGSGNLFYRGFPSIDSQISGSGRLIHVN